MDLSHSHFPIRKRLKSSASSSVAAASLGGYCRGSVGSRSSHEGFLHSVRQSSRSGNASLASGIRSSRSLGHLSARTNNHNHAVPHTHIVCAITENLARETCIVSLDTTYPVVLNITKQNNSQTYYETIACLSVLDPHEVLLNEGLQHSPLANTIVKHYKFLREDEQAVAPFHANVSNETSSSTVVKFISRSFFDQNRGADLLQKFARNDTYDSNSLVQEFILLSSSNAVLRYTQNSLGVILTSNCLDIRSYLSDPDGKSKPHVMGIDRSTLVQLELLSSAKPGKSKQASLLAAINCTRTTVGNRLLRSTIMAPPCRLATIHARQELVSTFLKNEPFFMSILGQLQNMEPIDKMITDIVMVPLDFVKHKPDTNGKHMDAVSTVTGVRASSNAVGKQNDMNAKVARKGISSLIGIKTTLSMLPLLASTLKEHLKVSTGACNEQERNTEASIASDKSSLLVGLGGDFGSLANSTFSAPRFSRKHYLLRGIIYALTQPELKEIESEIEKEVRGNLTFSRASNVAVHQECFALRGSPAGASECLDVYRKAFLHNVDEIYQKADEYAELHGIHVTVKYQNQRGHFLSLPASSSNDLPSIFIYPSKSGSGSGTYIHCTTEEVQSLNARAQDNVRELLFLTHRRIQELLAFASSKYDALARVSDAIALLDLCHGFADKVTLSDEEWTAPKLFDREEGETAENGEAISIVNGKCAVDVAALNQGMSRMVVNDTRCSPSSTFTIVSGVNGSGKSTYLKQVAMTVLLAHCGSWVPADEAHIPLTTRLCARMGSADDLENNISCFMKEMKETALICRNATTSSLLLLDELGRETSNEDGVAIAWAVCERLIQRGALTFFATHYVQLCQMKNVYPGVQNLHLHAIMPENGDGPIRYTHKIQDGPCVVASSYGVATAASSGFPEDVVLKAKSIERTVKGAIANRSNLHRDYDAERRCKRTMKDTVKRIHDSVNSARDLQTLRSCLQSIREDLSQALSAAEIDTFLRSVAAACGRGPTTNLE